MEQFLGQRLGSHYRIQSILGKQSGRRTFLAEDTDTKTPVVIKLVLFGPDFKWAELKLFEREADTLKSLDHPAIPKYLDSFEVNTALGKGFALVQTYLKAPSLQAVVTSGRRFSETDLRHIAQSLLTTLHYLHSAQPAVIHRDIKPSNILVSTREDTSIEQVYLVDFGSVQTHKTDGTMTVVGTYGYMPPEQFGGQAQPASDLYSLGATLLFLATGEHPASLLQDNLQLEFDEHLSLSASLTAWLKQLTYVELSRRTATASQALAQLTLPSMSAVLQTNAGHIQPSRLTAISRAEFRAHAEQRAKDDFQLYITPDEIEIELPQQQLKHNNYPGLWSMVADTIDLIFVQPDPNSILYKATTLGIVACEAGLMIAWAIAPELFSLVVISTLSGLTLFLMCRCLAPLRWIRKSKRDRVSVRITKEDDGKLCLSAIAPLSNDLSQPYPIARVSELNPLHIKNITIRSVNRKHRTRPLINSLIFVLACDKYHNHRGGHRVVMLGSEQQIRWTYEYFKRWNHNPS